MATSVALPLEKQFSTIPGLNVISSTARWATPVTLEFNEGRDIDAAAVDVQAALLRATRSLPQDMTQPPSYRKVNPADAPVLLLALTRAVAELDRSERLRRASDLTDPVHDRRRGAGQHQRTKALRGARACITRCAVGRNISLDELTTALRAANANTRWHARRAQANADAAGQPAVTQCGRVRRSDRRHAQRQFGTATRRRGGRRQLRIRQDRGQFQRQKRRSPCPCCANRMQTP